MRDDFGHDQHDVHQIIHELLAKLPDEASIRAIDISAGAGSRPGRLLAAPGPGSGRRATRA